MSCGVVQGEYVSEVFVWWGSLLSALPLIHHEGWLSLVVGCVVVVGGMALKGGCCDGDPPVCVLVSPLFSVGVPPVLFVWWSC